MSLDPEKQEITRKADGTFEKGTSGNPAGRPKGQSMKEFAREFLANMTPEDKKEWLKGLSPEIVWRMSEGNPHTTTDVTTGGESINKVLVQFVDAKDAQDAQND